MTLYEEAEQTEKAKRLIKEWSQSSYAKNRGITAVEVGYWLKKEDLRISWDSVASMLEKLVRDGRLVRTTCVGGRRVASPPYLPAYIYWPKEAKEILLIEAKGQGKEEIGEDAARRVHSYLNEYAQLGAHPNQVAKALNLRGATVLQVLADLRNQGKIRFSGSNMEWKRRYLRKGK